MKNLIKISGATLLLILLLTAAKPAMAKTTEAGASAKLATSYSANLQDQRVIILRKYLEGWNSPLAEYAGVFVEQADKYNLDWRLVAAISGLESSFGVKIPYDSYNGWGWGIYGNHVLRFNSWPEGIETISKGLRENYLRNYSESDPYIIGPTYAASPTWAQRVTFFMNQIESYRLANEKDALSISI